MANVSPANTTCMNLYEHRGTARVLLPLVYTVIFLLGLLGNTLALLAIRSNLAKLNSTTMYSANLAVSDLLFCLSLPLRGFYYAQGFHWSLGEGLCKVTALLFYLNSYAGVNFMTCLAVDRFVAVVLQPRLAWVRRPRSVRVVCLLVWLLVLAQVLPMLTKPLTKSEPNGTVTCMEFEIVERNVPYLSFMLIFGVMMGYGVPLVTILVCYSMLSRKLHLATKVNRLSDRSGGIRRSQRVVAGVVVVFVICFSPYHLDLLQYAVRNVLYDRSCEDLRVFQVSLQVTVCLMNFNSCLDPFVYFFACQGFKKKVLKLLKGQVGTSFSSVRQVSPESSANHDPLAHHSCSNGPSDNRVRLDTVNS